MTQLNKNDFTHLHLHSTFSILDGENLLPNIVKRVTDTGMKQVALTDHGNMYGALAFYKQCKKANIKPILGVEAYITADPDGVEKKEMNKDNNHLVMLAKDYEGFVNLMHLVSDAYTSNFYHKPRISKHNLTPERTKGIIATSACLGGELNRVGYCREEAVYKWKDKMEKSALFYKKAFPDGYYLEIQDNPDDANQQYRYNALLQEIGKEHGIPLVITSDAHYTTLEKAEVHSAIMATQLKMTLKEYKASSTMKYGPWFYIRTPDEMFEAAKRLGCEEAFWNACRIGNMCNVEIPLGDVKMPHFDIEGQGDYQDFLSSSIDYAEYE